MLLALRALIIRDSGCLELWIEMTPILYFSHVTNGHFKLHLRLANLLEI